MNIHRIRRAALAAALALVLPALPAVAQHGGHAASTPPNSPYAGWQARPIKALAPEEVQRLLDGHGMGLALAAELNGHPGPTHVLEHADALQLAPEQRARTRELLQTHKAAARALGARIVHAEQALDRVFAVPHPSEDEIERQVARIGTLQAQLRAEHLRTHLRQSALLTPAQIARYQVLRGYAAPAGPGR